jgi:hypothetical protein
MNDWEDSNGKTALDWCWEIWFRRNDQWTEALGSVENFSESRSFTPLHDAVARRFLQAEEFDQILKDHFRDINTPDRCKMTPLAWACCTGNLMAVKMLLQWGEYHDCTLYLLTNTVLCDSILTLFCLLQGPIRTPMIARAKLHYTKLAS